MSKFNKIEITAGGVVYTVDSIMLFDKKTVVEIANLSNQAATKLQGVHTGIGFIGSPGWVVGGGLLLGALENVASKSVVKDGLALLGKASSLMEKLRKEGSFFPISRIANVEIPSPNSWSAFGTTVLEQRLADLSYEERHKFIGRHSLSPEQIRAGAAVVSVTTEFSHGGDEFIVVQCEKINLNIRWSSVTAYRPIGPSQ